MLDGGSAKHKKSERDAEERRWTRPRGRQRDDEKGAPPPPPPPPSLPYKMDTSRPSLRTNWTRRAREKRRPQAPCDGHPRRDPRLLLPRAQIGPRRRRTSCRPCQGPRALRTPHQHRLLSDLLQAINALVLADATGECALTPASAIHCVSSVFKCLKNQGEVWDLDLQDFFDALFQAVPRLAVDPAGAEDVASWPRHCGSASTTSGSCRRTALAGLSSACSRSRSTCRPLRRRAHGAHAAPPHALPALRPAARYRARVRRGLQLRRRQRRALQRPRVHRVGAAPPRRSFHPAARAAAGRSLGWAARTAETTSSSATWSAPKIARGRKSTPPKVARGRKSSGARARP